MSGGIIGQQVLISLWHKKIFPIELAKNHLSIKEFKRHLPNMKGLIVRDKIEKRLINKLAHKEAPKLNITILTKRLEIMNTLTL
ncbi:hypothetical protein FAM21829_02640 [Lentilactobacillus parabuchneri]|nr:hypothetical protein FAM21829_02640 [Lentilactobacillus parabuchneri]